MAINFVPAALDAAKLRQLLRCYVSSHGWALGFQRLLL